MDSPDDTLAGIRTGALTPTRIVEASLARIAAFDPALHAFIHRWRCRRSQPRGPNRAVRC